MAATVTTAPAAIVSAAPSTIGFGDLVVVTVDGTGQPDFSPFTVRSRSGDRYVLQCLSSACLPGVHPVVIRLGGTRVRIVARATAAQVDQPLRSFARQTARLPTSYRIPPGLLLALLVAAAAGLLAAAGFLAGPIVRRSRPAQPDFRTPLERALDLVRASLGRDATDRRRALDLLARAIGRGPLSEQALTLAWSEPEPEPPRVAALVDEVVARGAEESA